MGHFCSFKIVKRGCNHLTFHNLDVVRNVFLMLFKVKDTRKAEKKYTGTLFDVQYVASYEM